LTQGIFADYLKNRKQFVQVNGINSLLVGVPQGSILGPLLFNLCIHDIEDAIDNFLHAYADDITSWVTGTNWRCISSKLTEIFSQLSTFLSFKGLQVNAVKCQLLVLGKKYLSSIRLNDVLDLRLGIKSIYESTDIELLGVTIDNQLSFTKHISEVLNKCEGNLRFLWRTANGRSLMHRKLL